MSQHPYISQELLQDPCLLFMSYSILIIRFCGPAQAKRKFWPPETRFVWPCAGKTVRPRSAGAFRAGETQILSSGDAFCVALRRENSPTECFAQAKRKFWTAEMHFLWPCAGETQILTSGDASCVQICGFTRSHDQMNENRHGATARRQKKIRAILTSGVAFSVALRSKKRGGQKKAPRPKRLYPYRKNPSVWHTVWGTKRQVRRRTACHTPICHSRPNTNLSCCGSVNYFEAIFWQHLPPSDDLPGPLSDHRHHQWASAVPKFHQGHLRFATSHPQVGCRWSMPGGHGEHVPSIPKHVDLINLWIHDKSRLYLHNINHINYIYSTIQYNTVYQSIIYINP